MTLFIDARTPAYSVLASQAYPVADAAMGVPPKTIRVALLNLMPDKAACELQMARLLAHAPIDVELFAFMPEGEQARPQWREHVARGYLSWREIRRAPIDALLVSGAPLETMAYERVRYWHALTDILDWSAYAVRTSLFSCWAAMAALYYFHGIPKQVVMRKYFGVYTHQQLRQSPLTRGVASEVPMPVSRYASVPRPWIDALPSLEVVLHAQHTGPGLIVEKNRSRIYLLNHPEYDQHTLADEYYRDRGRGLNTAPPAGGALDAAQMLSACSAWQRAGRTVMKNWLLCVRSAESPMSCVA